MSRTLAVAAFAVVALAAGCAPSLPASYTCTNDAQCRFGAQQGRCEASAACSFADSGCASGQRYGQFAPPGLAGACVTTETGDGGGGIGGGGGGGGDGGISGGSHITRAGTASVARAMRSSVTLPAPAGTTAGDLLLAVVLFSPASVTVTTPAGWTVQKQLSDDVGGNYRVVYFQHFLASGDPSSWTFTLSATASVTAAEVAYRNVDPTTPIDTSSNNIFQGAQFIAPSLTTTHDNDFLVAMYVQAQSMTLGWQPPAGMQVAIAAGDIGIFDVEQPTAGASGDKIAGFSVGNIPGVGAVDFVALVPK